MKKRILHLCMATMLLLAVAVNSFGQSVGSTVTHDGITYTYTSVAEDSRTVKVTGIDVTAAGTTEITIPATIKDSEGNITYKVTDCDFTSNNITKLTLPEGLTNIFMINASELTEINLPSTVKTIQSGSSYGLHGCSKLINIYVDDSNTTFSDIDGVLIYKGNELYQYPSGRTDTEYVVPAGVTSITEGGAITNTSLTSLNFGTTVAKVSSGALDCPEVTKVFIPKTLESVNSLTGLKKLHDYEVEEGHGVYSDIDGVLCSADKKTLIGYPVGRSNEDYELPASIEVIGANSFNGVKFSSFDFSKATNLTTIKSQAFMRANFGSTTLDLSSNVNLAKIEDTYAFYSCGLKILKLPESGTLKYIGTRTFDSNGLTEVNLPEGLETIGELAFSSIQLTEITIPSTLTSFGYGAFANDNKLTAVNVADGNSVYASDNGVLYNNDFTELIFYPRGKTDENYTVNSNTETLAKFSFSNTQVKTVKMPSTLVKIDTQAFSSSAIATIVWPEDCNLKSIGGSAFYSCLNLKEFNLPISVTTIGDLAFRNCKGLTSFKVPDNSNLTTLNLTIFYECPNVTSIAVGKNTALTAIKSNNSGATFYPSNLTTLTIDEGNTNLKTLEYRLFRGNGNNNLNAFNTKLTTLTIADDCGLETISAECFMNCTALTSLKLPASVKTLGTQCFYNTPNLKDLVFTDTDENPAQLEEIGENSFWLCGLTSFVVPRSVKTIKRQAFHSCEALEMVSIPAGTSSVDKEAFYLCEKLEAINVDKANETYASSDGIFCDKMKETLIIYPAGKATDSFQLLPPSITKIGPMSFFYSKKLKNVMIPKHVTEIGYSAFLGCENLKDIVLLGDDPASIEFVITSGGNDPFTDVPADATVWLRHDLQDKITNWNGFTNIDYCKMGVNDDANHQYEFFVMDDNTKSANVLSVKNNALDYTIVMPETVSDGTNTYHVDYLGDFMLEDALENVKEVVVKHTPKYVGANAFDSDFGHADAFFTCDIPSDDMSTIRFEYDKATFNGRYNEGQNLYMKKSVAERLKADETWVDMADAIQWQVPLPAISTNYGTFSREFAVDLDAINPDKENPNVIAFTAGAPLYDSSKNLTYVKMVSINHTGETPEGYSGEGDGTYIPANTGVLLKAYKGTSTAFTKATTNAETGETTEASGDYYQIAETQTDGYTGENLMASVTEHSRKIQSTETIDGKEYANFYVSKGQLWSVTTERTSTVHKSYLQLPSEVFPAGAKLMIIFDDGNDTTGIDGVQAVDNSSDVIYNLQGQRVENAVKGIYIINGKKVYVK